MTGITYVMAHPGFQSVKVGHTGSEENRVPQLMKHGWQPYRHLRSITIEQARSIEQATLFYVRFQLGIPVHLTRAHMGHAAGWTETLSAALITAKDVWELVCEQAVLEQLAPVVEKVRPVSTYRPVPPRRQKGDTPRYVKVARTEASRTARGCRVGGSLKPDPKIVKKDPS
jgi:hypothetical protein